MKIVRIEVHTELTMKARQDFSSQKFGGSITADIDPDEDLKQAFEKAWLIVQSQVIGKMAEKTKIPELEQEKEKIDEQLGF